jgi:hypothetical protein
VTGPQLGKDASGVPLTDLSGLFGGPVTAAVPDRAAGVPKLAPPPGRSATSLPNSSPAEPPTTLVPLAQDTAVAPPAVPASATTPEVANRVPAPRRARKSKKRHPSSVVVYLPVSLRTRLRVHATNTSRSHTQIVFDALNGTHDRLAELVTAARRSAEQPTDGLFVVQQPSRRVHSEDQVQVSIRPNPANLAVIDHLADRHTAGNRSALITLALHHFLPVGVDEHPREITS